MWMNASSIMVGASTLVSTQWAATSAAAKRASSSATTSTHASTALWVSMQNTHFTKKCVCGCTHVLIVLNYEKKWCSKFSEGLMAQWGVTGSSWLLSLSFDLQQQHAVGKESLCPTEQNKSITATLWSMRSVSQISLKRLCFVFFTEVDSIATAFHSIGSWQPFYIPVDLSAQLWPSHINAATNHY